MFIIYTDTLSRRLYELHRELGLNHHLFADDNTLWKTGPHIEVCAIAVQQGLDIVQAWSHEYKIPILVGKNEGLLFTNSPADRNMLREITLGEDTIVFTPKARLLGVILDTTINFGPHVDKLKSDVSRRLVQMRAIQGSDWGGSSKDGRALYGAYVLSKLDYGSSAFSSLLSATNMQKLEVLQNRGARIATGCLQTTNIESLLLEANLQPLENLFSIQCAVAAEKCRRLPEHDPLYQTATEKTPPTRLVRTARSWQQHSDGTLHKHHCRIGRLNSKFQPETLKKAQLADQTIDLRNREPVYRYPSVAPWDTEKANLVVFKPNLILPCTKEDSDEIRREASEATIDQYRDYGIKAYADGSVVDKLGAGAGEIRSDPNPAFVLANNDPIVINCAAPGGHLCSSYTAERVALKITLETIRDKSAIIKKDRSLFVASDSQSMISALGKGPLRQTNTLNADLWKILLQLVNVKGITQIVIQYVAAHCGIPGNERADVLANEALQRYNATKMKAAFKKSAIPLGSVKSELKRAIKMEWKNSLNPDKPRYAICGDSYSDLKFSNTLSRQDEVLLHQLRVGECSKMGKFRTRVGIAATPLCRWCNNAEETVLHVFSDCLNLSVIRANLKVPGATILHTDPELGLKFYHSL